MSDLRIRAALELLIQAIRSRIEASPHGHLVRGRQRIPLTLQLPLDLDPDPLNQSAEQTEQMIDLGVDELVTHAAAFRAGRMLCLRCQSPLCEHATPATARQVFAGYGPTGIPRFVDFATLMVDRRHESIEQLFADETALLHAVMLEDELTRDLLPAFREAQQLYFVHGQLIAGFWRVPDSSGRPEPQAISIQIVSTRSQRSGAQRRRRFGVNVIGQGPRQEPLEHLHDRLGTIPWALPVRWAQTALIEIENEEKRRSLPAGYLGKRVSGLLRSMARRLGRDDRARGRRTRHATERHDGGDRPTRMAIADLAAAKPDQLLYDTRQNTLVVIGDRGRAHVFNLEGKLVTSVRYPPHTVARRRETGLWRAAEPGEVKVLHTWLPPEVR
jgi:hypothetical protein